MQAAVRLVPLALALLAQPAGAITVSFTKIADAGMLGPGWAQGSVTFYAPALEAGLVAVALTDGFQPGIVTGSGGALTTVVDGATLVPGSTTPFVGTSNVSLSNGRLAFTGNDASYFPAVYTTLAGALAPIASFGMPSPDGGSTLQPYSYAPSLAGNNVAFYAVDPVNGHGFYTNVAGVLELTADQNTAVPGGAGILLFDGAPQLDGTAIAFVGQTTGVTGVYVADAGVARLVADTNTPAPGGSGNFLAFDDILAIDDGNVVFDASADGGGLYAEIDGNLVRITGEYVHAAAIDGDLVAWHGSSDSVGQPDSYTGLYVLYQGQREKVIEAADGLDGRALSFFTLGPEGLDGEQLAFTAWFEDGTSAVYLASIPEPGTALLLGFGLAALAARRR